MTLHLSQIFFTDALTFITSFQLSALSLQQSIFLSSQFPGFSAISKSLSLKADGQELTAYLYL
jgi:hypothetical protein